MRIIIVGDKGFIGSALKRKLRAEGHQIVSSYAKADICYYLANRGEDVYEQFSENLVALNRTLEQLCTQPLHFVLLSSAKVNRLRNADLYSDAYAVTKSIMEQMVVCYYSQPLSNFHYTIVRLNNVYGKAQKNPNLIGDMITLLKRNNPIALVKDASDETTYMYIDDCVRALIKLGKIKRGNRLITLGHTKLHSVYDVVFKIRTYLGLRTTLIHDTFKGTKRPADNKFFDWEMISLDEGIGKML